VRPICAAGNRPQQANASACRGASPDAVRVFTLAVVQVSELNCLRRLIARRAGYRAYRSIIAPPDRRANSPARLVNVPDNPSSTPGAGFPQCTTMSRAARQDSDGRGVVAP
jgi:hypothetical protein